VKRAFSSASWSVAGELENEVEENVAVKGTE
jgi:hypothetical protein